MDKLIINGPVKLCGEVEISGAKNAVVAILPAALLVDGICTVENIPNISDVKNIIDILRDMGAEVTNLGEHTLRIDSSRVNTQQVTYEHAKKLRASYYFMGALLGRYGKATVALPGGCHLGPRPIDQHIKAFEGLGATINVDHGNVYCEAEELQGCHILFDVVSVGATINAMLAAVRAEGLTVLENVAKEPHIVDVANFLNSMGAHISGAGTHMIKIRGQNHLSGGTYAVIPDQIEAGTFMMAAAATRGDVIIKNVIPKHLECITAKLREMNVTVEEYDDAIRVAGDKELTRTTVKTMPYPGFPTDMQPQTAVLMATIHGTSIINEGIWESRFKYVDELKKMGAEIQVDGKIAVIDGGEPLSGAPIQACDLRAGAALVIAGCVASGLTKLEEIHHIERGYENIVEKFRGLGAIIDRISEPDNEGDLQQAN